MNKEIKEIREYISCPQFGDDHYGKWGSLRLDQRTKIKKLLDYITNLQEENERLNKDRKELIRSNVKLRENKIKALHLMNHVEEYDYRLFIERLEKILEGDK